MIDWVCYSIVVRAESSVDMLNERLGLFLKKGDLVIEAVASSPCCSSSPFMHTPLPLVAWQNEITGCYNICGSCGSECTDFAVCVCASDT